MCVAFGAGSLCLWAVFACWLVDFRWLKAGQVVKLGAITGENFSAFLGVKREPVTVWYQSCGNGELD